MNLSDWITQVRRGTVEYCVLILVRDEARYGYDIVTTLSNWEQLASKEGTLYPLLRRLQKDELIDSFWQESESGPPRKYYISTDKGKEYLHLMDQEWGKLTNAIVELKNKKGENLNGEQGKPLFR